MNNDADISKTGMRQPVLKEWNETTVSHSQIRRIDELFESQVNKTPDAVAVELDGYTLTYQGLNERANQLAHYLQNTGVTADTLVGICADRSLEMVVGILATLKAGGAYVPLDPAYPKERLAYMLENAQAPLLLTQHHLIKSLPDSKARMVCLDADWETIAQESRQPPPNKATPDHLAYVIYTSGSTGKPKGVAMEHRALFNLIAWQLENSTCKQGARTLQFTPLSFDVSFQEIFSTLCAGGTLVLVSDELRLDTIQLLDFLNRESIERLFLPFIALQHLAEVVEIVGSAPSALKEIITAGEQLQVNRYIIGLFEKLEGCTLYNHYGPSETHVVTSYTLTGAAKDWPTLPPIGRPIWNTQIYLLNEKLQPVGIGEEGELFIGGMALARGYLNRSDLTSERFVANPFSDEPKARLYKTGDLARYLPDGNIEFLGRIDGQVKIRGYRIELGEIEVVLAAHSAVKQVVVLAREDEPGNKRLVAYIVANENKRPTTSELRRFMQDRVPDYMVPAAFVVVDAMPRTPSGKIDRRALPAPANHRPDLEQNFVAPQNEMERLLTNMWCSSLKLDRVGIYDNFFDLGGNSLLSLQFVAHLRQTHGIDLPIVKFFQYPTIHSLAHYLCQGPSERTFYDKAVERVQRQNSIKSAHRKGANDVAIIGMSGRFPGADNIDELWRNLCDGVESITFFSDGELDPSIDQRYKKDPNYVKARGILHDADKFDAAFFGISPREAEVMDPQQRVFLEVAWEALEHAGYVPESFDGLIGVYAGTGNNTYFLNNVVGHRDLIEMVGEFQTMVSNEKDYVATRVSHKLNLTGPSLSIHTACSTSLVAVCQAYQSLVDQQCDMALAGGVAITVPQKSGYLYEEGGINSVDGHCRPFDEHAQGTVFSDGVGVVLLKRLEEALSDGDAIYGVIRGAAINNDGSHKASFTAPSVEGQATVIAMAQAMAEVEPETITYIETHGTATPLGDPIEIEALTQAFQAKTDKKGYCAIGSVKSNFGHLTAAAGVTGLIKTTLSLQNKKLPPILYFHKPNPKINFTDSPFFVNDKLTEWTSDAAPRRAGVSSFGVGGTNAHVVLEEAPEIPATGSSRPRQLLLLSAKTGPILDKMTVNMREHFVHHPETPLILCKLDEKHSTIAVWWFAVTIKRLLNV